MTPDSPRDRWLACAAVCGGLSVAAGAFAAHALKDRLSSEHLAVFETAARYQMYHALAIGLVALRLGSSAGRAVRIAAWSFLVGIILFSGSLYALACSGIRGLGAITPFGGVAFLIGWAAVAFDAIRARSRSP